MPWAFPTKIFLNYAGPYIVQKTLPFGNRQPTVSDFSKMLPKTMEAWTLLRLLPRSLHDMDNPRKTVDVEVYQPRPGNSTRLLSVGDRVHYSGGDVATVEGFDEEGWGREGWHLSNGRIWAMVKTPYLKPSSPLTRIPCNPCIIPL